MKRLLLVICFTFAITALFGQTKLIKDLQRRHTDLQKQIAATEQLLKTTKKDVRGQLEHLAALNGQIENRIRYIESMNNDVHSIEGEVSVLSSQLGALERDLNEKKQKYQSSVFYLYKNKTIQEKLMFIFSAKNLSQTYRRLRYVKEYATYQRLQGEEIKKKQAIVDNRRGQLIQVKRVKVGIVKEREGEKAKLVEQQQMKQTLISNLQKKQRGLQSTIGKKRKEANQLNFRIDRLISIEIEKARKRAEEEARHKRELEAKRAAEIAAKNRADALAASKDEANMSSTKSNSTKRKSKEIAKAPSVKSEDYMMSSVDRRLSDNFASNCGRLPMPITGSYIVASHYGEYAVEGMRNVKLDNKGIDIQGHPGACARAIFNGEVSAVFQLNGLVNILVRHGDYISVYCNLSSASVRQGEKVNTRQILGKVFSDNSDNGRTILHFQLRKERAKLNPEQWLGR